MMEDKPMTACEMREVLREVLKDKLTVERYEILELLRKCRTLDEAVALIRQRIAAGKA
jgi:hypothetical protein